MREKTASKDRQDNDFIKSLADKRITEEHAFSRHKHTYINKKSLNELDEVVSETSEITSKIPTEPDFIKLYLNDVVVLKGVQSGYKDILFQMLKLMKYEDYIVSISKYDKEIIAKNLGIEQSNSVQQIDNAIGKLKKAGIIMSVVDKDGKTRRGVYEFNPFLFGKGKWVENYNARDINKLTILYQKNNKEVVNVDAIIEYISTEKDEEKRNKAIETLRKIQGYDVN